jgi:hypothetical protein
MTGSATGGAGAGGRPLRPPSGRSRRYLRISQRSMHAMSSSVSTGLVT